MVGRLSSVVVSEDRHQVLAFIIRRVITIIPLMILISIVSFIIIELPPGDWVTVRVEQLRSTGVEVDNSEINRLNTQYGLDQPGYIRYVRWVSNMLRGDFGYSFQWNVNGVTSSSTAGKKALRGITSYTVTVTDAQGCTAVFNGRGNPVCPRVPLSDYQLALLAGSLAVAAGFAVRKLMKK